MVPVQIPSVPHMPSKILKALFIFTLLLLFFYPLKTVAHSQLCISNHEKRGLPPANTLTKKVCEYHSQRIDHYTSPPVSTTTIPYMSQPQTGMYASMPTLRLNMQALQLDAWSPVWTIIITASTTMKERGRKLLQKRNGGREIVQQARLYCIVPQALLGMISELRERIKPWTPLGVASKWKEERKTKGE